MNNGTNGRGRVNPDGTVVRPSVKKEPVRPAATQAAGRQQSALRRPVQQRPMQQRPAQQRPAAPQRHPTQQQKPIQQRPVQSKSPQQKSAPRKKADPRSGRQAPQRSPGTTWVYPEGGTPYAQVPPPRRTPQRPHPQRPNKKALRRQKRKRTIAVLKSVLLRFLVVFLLTALLSGILYYKTFHSAAKDVRTAVTYQLSNEKNAPITFKASAQTAYYSGTLYIDFSAVASWLELPSVGSIYYMRYIAPGETAAADSAGNGTEESILLIAGSFTATVNGTNLDMPGPCRVIDGDLWIPLSFVEHYISGVYVTQSGDTVSLSRFPEQDKKNSSDKNSDKKEEATPETVSFRLKPGSAIPHIEYDESYGA